ncbi:hypothetical protein [Pseudooceanicola sp. MF1-13]|uniref:hypothetical protein n=1 Tax=Pseudooceanicola sp. MF1-13 TaxID=3379095 RepID=UPI00389162DF
MLRWLRSLFGPKPSVDAVTIANAYDTFVLGAGPAAGTEGHIGSEQLAIPASKISDFVVKRIYMHEAFLFAAFSIVEHQCDADVEAAPPFTTQIAAKLRSEWTEREGEILSAEEIGERCFGVVDRLVNDPVGWSRAWLSEFYPEPGCLAEHAEGWAKQCTKEFLAIKRVAADQFG